MEKFSEVLETLEPADHLQSIEFYDIAGKLADKLISKPGTKGSMKVYQHLFNTFGRLNEDAAIEGLALFCEHTEEAEMNPGKHPNIDRLFEILENDAPMTMKLVEA